MGAKCNFLNLIGHLQGLSNYILAYYLFRIPWNIHEDQVTRFWKKNIISRPLFDPRDENKNSKAYCTYTRHTQSYLEYSLSTIWYVDGVEVTSLIWQNTSLFNPHMTQGGKMKIPNPYCTSATHSYPRVSIVYHEKSRWIVQLTNFTEI